MVFPLKPSIYKGFSMAMLVITRGYWFFECSQIAIGSMVLLYMVLHGSHQYIPNVSIYTSTMDPMG